jgi:hypothetical protein
MSPATFNHFSLQQVDCPRLHCNSLLSEAVISLVSVSARMRRPSICDCYRECGKLELVREEPDIPRIVVGHFWRTNPLFRYQVMIKKELFIGLVDAPFLLAVSTRRKASSVKRLDHPMAA